MSYTSRNDPCPCGSEKKYKHCHGKLGGDEINTPQPVSTSNNTAPTKSTSQCVLNHNGYYTDSLMKVENKGICKDLPIGRIIATGSVPDGMFIIDDFLDDKICTDLITHTELVHSKKATIVKSGLSNSEKVDEQHRKTDVFDLGQYDSLIKQKIVHYFKGLFKQNYNASIAWYEQPQLLRYVKGGFYRAHSDSESWNMNQKKWHKTMARDYSFLIYLNEEFTGGEIEFPNFKYKLIPKKGMFVCFPSDHRFIHKVNPTHSGIRYVIVTWAASNESQSNSHLEVTPEHVIQVN